MAASGACCNCCCCRPITKSSPTPPACTPAQTWSRLCLSQPTCLQERGGQRVAGSKAIRAHAQLSVAARQPRVASTMQPAAAHPRHTCAHHSCRCASWCGRAGSPFCCRMDREEQGTCGARAGAARAPRSRRLFREGPALTRRTRASSIAPAPGSAGSAPPRLRWGPAGPRPGRWPGRPPAAGGRQGGSAWWRHRAESEREEGASNRLLRDQHAVQGDRASFHSIRLAVG